MDAVLSVISMAVVVAGGFGATVLLFGRREKFDILELISLAIYFGGVSVTLSLFFLGYLFRHPFVTVIVSLVQLALLAAGIAAWRRSRPGLVRWSALETIAVLGVLLAQTAFVLWTSLHTAIGWDGMVIFDFKAHLIALHHGHMPVSHFTDARLRWTHNSYPLFYPLWKAWLYLWLGQTHQQLGKIVEVLLYLAAAAQIYSGVRRMTGSIGGAFTAVIVLFAVPFIHLGSSVGSSQADFPLAAFYLAAVRYVVQYATSGSRRDLMLAGSLLGAGCWLKQDGSLLWLAAMLLLLLLTAKWKERWTWLIAAAAPAVAALGGWKLFLVALKAEPENVYMPMTIANFIQYAPRIMLSLSELGQQLLVVHTWSAIWLMVPLAALTLILRPARLRASVLLGGTVVPMLLFCSVYIFTNWDPLLHIRTSLPRLLLSPFLVAVMLIGFGVGEAWNLLRNPIRMYPSRIALLTDFGSSDPYVGSMKGVIAAGSPVPVFDLAHDIAPQDVFGAAWFLRTAERWWPAGTIFVCVVDPGVGTRRRIIAARRDDRVFLAPDNGLLTFVAEGAEVRSVEDGSMFVPDGSNTFHGRDRFAPVAAAIANGTAIESLGPRIDDMKTLDYKPGMIVSIDRFGNAITDIEPPDGAFALKSGKVTIDRICRTYEEGGKEPFLIVGSSGLVEISIRNGNAAATLHLKRGDRVQVISSGA